MYLIHGAEDLLILESQDYIRRKAYAEGFTERSRFYFDARSNWDSVFAELKSPSLFSEKKIIEINIPLGRPGKSGSSSLLEIMDLVTDDHLLIIICGKLEKNNQRSKWFTSFSSQAKVIECKKVYPSQMPSWISTRLRDKGLKIERDALNMFVALTEGNLFAVMQSIDRLMLMGIEHQVSLDDVNDCVADGAHFDLFQLTDAAISSNSTRTFTIFKRLQKEGMQPFEVMRVINWEIKNLFNLSLEIASGYSVKESMQKAKIWQSKQKITGNFLDQINHQYMELILSQACSVDKVIKGASVGDPWSEIGRLLYLISNPKREAA
jgi:DNA polymerase-3 subunit delta